MDRCRATIVLGLAVLIAPVSGCRTGVRDFAELNDPAPFVRARAAGLDEFVSDAEAIPALIEHLDDDDPVVRLSSHEALRDRTGQDFGYIPYGTPEERIEAADRWRQWWRSHAGSPARRRPPPPHGHGPRG